MTDAKYYVAVRDGVRDAILQYADEHCVSFPDAIEAGVREAMREYLEVRRLKRDRQEETANEQVE